MFIDDLELSLQTSTDSGLQFDDIRLILMLYADDMVLLGETAEHLQHSLDNLKLYCDKWGLEVNVDKSKLMVFRKRGHVRPNETWTYNSGKLELVEYFNYLGVVFSSNGLFNLNQQMLIGKSLKAMNILFHKMKDFEFSPKTQCQLFDVFVSSILNYGSEVTGNTKSKEMERIHLKFCKRLLGVK